MKKDQIILFLGVLSFAAISNAMKPLNDLEDSRELQTSQSRKPLTPRSGKFISSLEELLIQKAEENFLLQKRLDEGHRYGQDQISSLQSEMAWLREENSKLLSEKEKLAENDAELRYLKDQEVGPF